MLPETPAKPKTKDEIEKGNDERIATSKVKLKLVGTTSKSDLRTVVDNSPISETEVSRGTMRERFEGKAKPKTVRQLLTSLYGMRAVKSLVRTLDDSLLDTPIEFVDGGATMATTVTNFSTGEVTIKISNNILNKTTNFSDGQLNKFLDVILTHELIHVGLNRSGKTGNRTKLDGIQAYLKFNEDTIKKMLAKYNIEASSFEDIINAKNSAEIITYALTDSRFTALFNDIQSPEDSNKSIWDEIKAMVLNILGVKVNKQSVLANVMDIAIQANLFDEQQHSPVAGESTTASPITSDDSPAESKAKDKIAKNNEKIKPVSKQLTLDFNVPPTVEEIAKEEKSDEDSSIKFDENTDINELEFAVYAESSIIC